MKEMELAIIFTVELKTIIELKLLSWITGNY
jgi:hypothetical protein